jgi:hypothetical protein
VKPHCLNLTVLPHGNRAVHCTAVTLSDFAALPINVESGKMNCSGALFCAPGFQTGGGETDRLLTFFYGVHKIRETQPAARRVVGQFSSPVTGCMHQQSQLLCDRRHFLSSDDFNCTAPNKRSKKKTNQKKPEIF